MATVTQAIPNFLGGVSKQPDVKKQPGQLRTCINAYPDPTFGLCKRPGTKWMADLGASSTFTNAEWFYIHRDSEERYVGCITTAPEIKVWNVNTGVQCTVTQPNTAYLTPAVGSQGNIYHILTIQDTTIITNRTKVVSALAAPSFTPGLNVTIELNSIQYEVEYKVVVNSLTYAFTTRASSTAATLGPLTYDEVLTTLKTGIDALGISGLTVTRVDGSLELVGTSALTVTASGGVTDNSLVVKTDAVMSIADLPTQSINGRVFKILNTTSAEDDYWVKFKATFGSSGTGVWEEAIAPNASTGLNAATMPHQLVNTALNTFEFKAITWESRLTGNDTTNPMPSFVGHTIQFALFAADRLGFLSEQNLIMSQAQDYYNFFSKSSRTQLDSDPVDIAAGDNRPTLLFSALQITQGILLFSENAQFMLVIDGGITPSSAVIKRIANYQVDTQIYPLDTGTDVVFLSKTLGFTRAFKMATQGDNNNPQVIEISRVVMEWIPNTIDELMVSADNSFIGLSSRTSNTAYFYRTYNNGERDLMQAWYQWQMPGKVQFMEVDGDIVLFVTEQNNKVALSMMDLNHSTALDVVAGVRTASTNLVVDLYTEPNSVTYNSATNTSTITLTQNDVPSLTPRLVVVGDASVDFDSGFTIKPTRTNTSNVWSVYGIDLTTKQGKILVGFDYLMDVELPTTYFRTDAGYDFTAMLTVSRYKVYAGISGVFTFETKARGSQTWTNVVPTISADSYLANDIPLESSMTLEVPIHQKNDNFTFKIKSDSPFLTTLNGMMWEGKYSPRNYRRVG